VAGNNVGTFPQRARSGRGCLARASAGDRAVAAQDGLASLCRLQGGRRRSARPQFRGIVPQQETLEADSRQHCPRCGARQAMVATSRRLSRNSYPQLRLALWWRDLSSVADAGLP
jgi:hypothetical protein